MHRVGADGNGHFAGCVHQRPQRVGTVIRARHIGTPMGFAGRERNQVFARRGVIVFALGIQDAPERAALDEIRNLAHWAGNG